MSASDGRCRPASRREMSGLRARFLRFVRARSLTNPGDSVLVALSGGIDSIVLLHLFEQCKSELQIEVRAGHFDHAMRPESVDDAAWVARLCETWQVPLQSGRSAERLSGETAARAARYDFLSDAMRGCGCNKLATAHHADDQIETVLLRLLRGAGLRGLAGIPLRRGAIIRPLLPFTKAEIRTYARVNALEYREDASNEDQHIMRNRIRQSVLPELESRQPGARAMLRDLARHAARTEAAWRVVLGEIDESLVVSKDRDSVELARPMLLEYHPEVRARVLRHLLRRQGVVPDRAHTGQLVEFCENARSGAFVNVGRHVRMERVFDRIRIVRLRPGSPDRSLLIGGREGRQELLLDGASYVAEWHVSERPQNGFEAFDYAGLPMPLELRAWRAGDRITLSYGSKKLKKLLGERRVPAFGRARVPVLTDHNGRVLWVVGVARSVHALPPATGPVLNVMVKNAESR